MYLITTIPATSSTARFRMPELCLPALSGPVVEGRVNAEVVAVRIAVDTPASFKSAIPGVRAWSPPV